MLARRRCPLFGFTVTMTQLWWCYVTVINWIKASGSLIFAEKRTRSIVLFVLVLLYWCVLSNTPDMVFYTESTMQHKTWCDSCGSIWIHTCNIVCHTIVVVQWVQQSLLFGSELDLPNFCKLWQRGRYCLAAATTIHQACVCSIRCTMTGYRPNWYTIYFALAWLQQLYSMALSSWWALR